MRGGWGERGARLGLALAALVLGAAAGARAQQCGVCHPQERVAYSTSAHAGERLACVDCHGGDATSRQVETAHRGGFRALGDRRAIPAFCAECHADLARMRPYNLPVDQFAVYQTSQHGMAVARGDERAAVCTDCHGTHDVRKVADPEGSVHHRNLSATCGRCHSDEALMESYRLDPGVVAAYRAGVHGQALLGRGNAAAPACTGCHGVHGPAPPGYSDIEKVCGGCHLEARRAFLAGPHREAMDAAGLPECVSCHSHHEVRALGVDKLDSLCAECHDEDSEQVALGHKMRALIVGALSEVEEAEGLIGRGERAAIRVEDHLSRLEEARTYLTEAADVVHTVTLEDVEEITRRARSIGEEIQHEIYEKLDRSAVHLGLALFWFYLTMTLVILLTYKRRLGRGRS